MFPIFIFTGMGSEPQNAFLPPCGCCRRKQKQQMPCAAATLPVKKRIPENPQMFRNSSIKIMFPLNMARVQRRSFETYGYTLKSSAISATSSGAKSPSVKISRASVSCGRAARIVLSSLPVPAGGQTVCTPSAPVSTRAR